MALVRWDPINELAGLEIDRLNRMFSDLYNESVSRAWVPPVDIYETENRDVVIKAELPEMKREQITVTFENNVLTLKGERAESEVSQDRFRRVERRYGHLQPLVHAAEHRRRVGHHGVVQGRDPHRAHSAAGRGEAEADHRRVTSHSGMVR